MNGIFVGIVICGIIASILLDSKHWRSAGRAVIYGNVVLYALVAGLLIPQIMRMDLPMPTVFFSNYVSPFVKSLLGI
ncbi:MAG TPA: hypothetical protein VF260_11295 [Bacilli bacterium]